MQRCFSRFRSVIAQRFNGDAMIDSSVDGAFATGNLTQKVISLAEKIAKHAPEKAETLLSLINTGLKPGAGEEERYRLAEALSTAIYPKYKFSEFARLFLEDEAFLNYYKRFMDADNWHSFDRKYTLDQLLKSTLHLPGDLVECGTYKGASAYLMCRAHRNSEKSIHLFDSFEGLSSPDPCDGSYWKAGALSIPEEVLHETLAEFRNYQVHKGWIPERFIDVAERCFCFFHLDVDLYQPTLTSLDFFYERMTAGGMILLDDYGFKTCPGTMRAADQFFHDRPENIIMLSTGQAFIIKQ